MKTSHVFSQKKKKVMETPAIFGNIAYRNTALDRDDDDDGDDANQDDDDEDEDLKILLLFCDCCEQYLTN